MKSAAVWIASACVVLVACGSPDRLRVVPKPLPIAAVGSFPIVDPEGGQTGFEPSGLTVVDGALFVISDQSDRAKIYRLQRSGDYYQALTHKSLQREQPGGLFELDFEGLTHDGKRFLIANEEDNSGIWVGADGEVAQRRFELKAIHRRDQTAIPIGTSNAGIEGIAWDRSSGRLFVAIERQYRTLYEVDPMTFAAKRYFDFPAGQNLPRWEPMKSGPGFWSVFPDYSGLWAENGCLYVLTRNEPAVLKIDPDRVRLLDSVALKVPSTTLYESDEPFGMAEGLAMTEDQMFVVLDNGRFKRRGSRDDRRATLLVFARPKGF